MSDASCRLIGVLFDMLDERGVPREAILRGTELELATLTDERGWIAWDDLCTVVQNTTEIVGGLDALEEEALRLLFGSASNRGFTRITRVLASPRALYRAFPRWIVPQLFSMLTVEREELGETHVRFVSRYDARYRELPEQARLIRATLTGLPTVLGLPRARVVMSCRGRECVYDVYHPASRTLLSRLVRVWQALFAPDSLTRELETQAANLMASNRELALAREREERASRAKSRFLSLISHELRTPLNGILGTVTIMLDTALSPRQRELVASNRASAAHLSELIDTILGFTELYEGEAELRRRSFSLGELMRARVARWEGVAAARGTRLSASWPPEVGLLLGDADRIGGALDHLLSNAVGFTRGGTITASVRLAEGGVCFEVSDTGCGMSPELQRRAWEPLVRGDDSMTRDRDGLGLGLAMVRHAAELMGGAVHCRSAEGEGTTIGFTLPLEGVPADGELPELELDEDWGARNQPARVLIVEDHPVNQMILRRMVCSMGFDVEVASDGREGVDRYTAGDYDAVLMDCQMPVMDGHTATRHIRRYEASEAQRRVPIIAVTAHALDSDRRQALAAGMDRYLTKPVDRTELQQTLSDLLAA